MENVINNSDYDGSGTGTDGTGTGGNSAAGSDGSAAALAPGIGIENFTDRNSDVGTENGNGWENLDIGIADTGASGGRGSGSGRGSGRGRKRKRGRTGSSRNTADSRGTAGTSEAEYTVESFPQLEPEAIPVDDWYDKKTVKSISPVQTIASILQGISLVPVSLGWGPYYALADAEAKKLAQAYWECIKTLPKAEQEIEKYAKKFGPWITAGIVSYGILMPKFLASEQWRRETEQASRINPANTNGAGQYNGGSKSGNENESYRSASTNSAIFGHHTG